MGGANFNENEFQDYLRRKEERYMIRTPAHKQTDPTKAAGCLAQGYGIISKDKSDMEVTIADYLERKGYVQHEQPKGYMNVHRVKSWSMFFTDILSGERTSDIRRNDRRYHVGDYMLLQEYNPVQGSYTGRVQTVQITYIQGSKSNPCAISRDALHDDYVVLSIKIPDVVPGYVYK
jgi:hypothetical protein